MCWKMAYLTCVSILLEQDKIRKVFLNAINTLPYSSNICCYSNIFCSIHESCYHNRYQLLAISCHCLFNHKKKKTIKWNIINISIVITFLAFFHHCHHVSRIIFFQFDLLQLINDFVCWSYFNRRSAVLEFI